MSCKISLFDGSIDIKYHLNNKCPFCQFIMTWKTSEEPMLRAILSKFVAERILTKGINSRNNIINAYVGKSSIMIYVPDNKFFSVIKQIYNTLFTFTVKIQGDYQKLVKDIKKGCSIICTGKIKTLQKHLSSQSPKIELLKKTLKELKIKERGKNVYNGKGSIIQENLENQKLEYKVSGKVYKFTENNKFDLAMLLSKCPIPFWFEGDYIYGINVELIDNCIVMTSPQLLKTIQYQTKKDDDESLKVLNKMICTLYNLKDTKSDIDSSKIAIPKMIFE